MTDWPILSAVTFLPLVGVLLILFIRDEGPNARRNIRAIEADVPARYWWWSMPSSLIQLCWLKFRPMKQPS